MTIEERFRTAVSRFGRDWRPENKAPSEAEAIGNMLTIFRSIIEMQKRAIGPNGRIYCGLVESNTINAFAMESEEHEFVAILTGLIGLVFSAYNCFLADPDTLSEIGDPSKEIARTDIADILKSPALYAKDRFPTDGERKALGEELALFSCIFILLHEVGHVVCGHTSFLRKYSGLPSYDELPALPLSQDESALRLAFEWEADEYAAIAGYQVFRAIQARPESFPHLGALDVDRAWGICVTMVFALIGFVSGGRLDVGSATHPRPWFRYLWSMVSVESSDACRAHQPKTASLQQGFTDVGGWFLRNGLSFRIDTSPDDGLKGLSSEYEAAKSALVAHLPSLRRAERARRTIDSDP